LVFTWEGGGREGGRVGGRKRGKGRRKEGEGEERRERECMQLYDSVLEQALSYCTSVVANVIPLG